MRIHHFNVHLGLSTQRVQSYYLCEPTSSESYSRDVRPMHSSNTTAKSCQLNITANYRTEITFMSTHWLKNVLTFSLGLLLGYSQAWSSRFSLGFLLVLHCLFYSRNIVIYCMNCWNKYMNIYMSIRFSLWYLINDFWFIRDKNRNFSHGRLNCHKIKTK